MHIQSIVELLELIHHFYTSDIKVSSFAKYFCYFGIETSFHDGLVSALYFTPLLRIVDPENSTEDKTLRFINWDELKLSQIELLSFYMFNSVH